MIHRTADIAPGARLGAGVEVGPFAVIEDGVVIGEGCRIAAHAVIKRHTSMGARNRVLEHAVIGGDPQDFKFDPATVSATQIGDDNVFREGMTIHRGSRPGSATKIGSHCYFMAVTHVAHDCRVGDHVVMVNNAGLSGECVVQDRAILAGAVGVHQFCRVGRLAMVGMNSKLVQDALPFCITDGNPARARGINVVGLRRAGFKAGDIDELKDAYRLLYRRVALPVAIAQMAGSSSAPVKELAAFFAGIGKRGFAHPASEG
jgi:UDP-N-acetylglucosamine acyltransferase